MIVGKGPGERDYKVALRAWWRAGQYQRAARKSCAPGEPATCEKESTSTSRCSFFGGSGERGGASWVCGGGVWRRAGPVVTGVRAPGQAGWRRGDRGGHTLKLPARGGRMRTGASAAGRARWACPGTWPIPLLALRVPRVPNAPRAMVVGCLQGPRV